MKKRVIYITSIFVGTILTLALAAFGADSDSDRESRERQVKVRVFSGNARASDLKQADFKVFGKESLLPVTGFKITRRSMRPETQPGAAARFMVLDFRLSQYTEEARRSAAHVFNFVLTEQDRLLVSAGDRTLYFERVSDKIKAFGVVESVLKEQAAWTRKQMHAEIKGMEEFIDWVRKQAKEDVHPGATYGNWKGVHPHYYMKYLKNCIERYVAMLSGYKEKFLLPDAAKYSRLFSQLEQVEGEKWLISFYQSPVLPKYSRRNRDMINEWVKELSQRGLLDEQDYVKKLGRLQDNIDDAFEVSSELYDPLFSEMVQGLCKADITFHSIFLLPDVDTHARELERKVFVKKDIQSALKKRFSEVARLTGGALAEAGALDPQKDSSPLLNKEDVYYTLSYGAPATNDLKVEVGNGSGKTYRPVYYAHQPFTTETKFNSKKAADIRIEDISFKKKTLSMIINGFAKANGKNPPEKRKGKLNVLVRIIDGEGKIVFNKKKALLAQKESIALSLDFNWLKTGKYFLITDAKDLITGKAWAHVSGFEVQ
jgi:hypothetical protein